MKLTYFLVLIFVFLNQSFTQETQTGVSSVFGFVQPIYQAEFTNNKIQSNQFLINRFRIGVVSKISDWIKAEVEIDPMDKTLIKDAMFRIEIFKNFNLSIGRQKMPFARERLTSVKEIQYFERTKVVKEFDDFAYAGRDIGVIASYETNFNKFKVNLAAGVFNGNKGDLNGDYNNLKSFVQRIEINYKKFSFGFNSALKFDSLTSKYFIANGIDFNLELIKNLTFTSEFLIGRKNQSVLIGGEYFAFEYTFDKLIFGARFSQFYSDIKKSVTNYYEAKADYKLSKAIKFSVNWLGESKASNFKNSLSLGVSYVL